MLKNTDFVLGSVKLRGCEEPTRDLRLVPHLSSFPEGLKKSAFGDCVGGYLGLRLTLAHLQAWLQVGGAIQGLGFRGYIENPRKLEHGFRRIRARIPYTLP